MKIKFVLLLVGILLLLTLAAPVVAQRVCNPFTTTPDANMLPIGQVVDFLHYEGGPAPVTRTGKITAYYILNCWPMDAVIGLDPQAYVVDYGAADHSQIVLNYGALTLRSRRSHGER